jgi:hypothetical protein
LDRETLWAAYSDNLRYVLDTVETLRENIETDSMVVTSDHANAIGEFGIYGHPKNVPHPAIRRVPWVEVDAHDGGAYVPERPPPDDTVSATIEDRLSALGYR